MVEDRDFKTMMSEREAGKARGPSATAHFEKMQRGTMWGVKPNFMGENKDWPMPKEIPKGKTVDSEDGEVHKSKKNRDSPSNTSNLVRDGKVLTNKGETIPGHFNDSSGGVLDEATGMVYPRGGTTNIKRKKRAKKLNPPKHLNQIKKTEGDVKPADEISNKKEQKPTSPLMGIGNLTPKQASAGGIPLFKDVMSSFAKEHRPSSKKYDGTPKGAVDSLEDSAKQDKEIRSNEVVEQMPSKDGVESPKKKHRAKDYNADDPTHVMNKPGVGKPRGIVHYYETGRDEETGEWLHPGFQDDYWVDFPDRNDITDFESAVERRASKHMPEWFYPKYMKKYLSDLQAGKLTYKDAFSYAQDDLMEEMGVVNEDHIDRNVKRGKPIENLVIMQANSEMPEWFYPDYLKKYLPAIESGEMTYREAANAAYGDLIEEVDEVERENAKKAPSLDVEGTSSKQASANGVFNQTAEEFASKEKREHKKKSNGGTKNKKLGKETAKEVASGEKRQHKTGGQASAAFDRMMGYPEQELERIIPKVTTTHKEASVKPVDGVRPFRDMMIEKSHGQE